MLIWRHPSKKFHLRNAASRDTRYTGMACKGNGALTKPIYEYWFMSTVSVFLKDSTARTLGKFRRCRGGLNYT